MPYFSSHVLTAPNSTTSNTVTPTNSTTTELTLMQPVLSASPVTWTSIPANSSASGNTITKNSSNGNWDGGATTVESIASGKNGWIIFNSPASNFAECGLSSQAGNAFANMDFGIYFVGPTTYQFIDGGSAFTGGSYATTDTWKINITNNVVTYFKNGSLIRTSSNTPTYPQKGKAIIFSTPLSFTATIVTDSSAAQSVDMLDVKDSSGTILFAVDKYGQSNLNSGITINRTATAASYTALQTDLVIGVTSTASARTITLPAAATVGKKLYIIKDESGAAGTNNITIARSGSDTIDGGTSATIYTNYGYISLYSDGVSAWYKTISDRGTNKLPTIQTFTSTGTTTGYLFTISTSTTCAVGDTYTNNSNTYTVLGALSAQTGAVLFMSGASAPTATGTLTRSAGAGTSSITFTANAALATYTPPANALYLKVRMVGGGAGGRGSGTGSIGTTNPGLSTYFGVNLLAANGAPATSTTTGGLGGTASLGTAIGVAFSGGSGSGGVLDVTSMGINGSPGGNSAFGGAGGGGHYNVAGQNAAANSGSGGGGGGSNGVSGSQGGQSGGAGGYVDAVITNPLASYPYAIGTKGAGGTAGTSGVAGGNGADGIIIIEEHYQ